MYVSGALRATRFGRDAGLRIHFPGCAYTCFAREGEGRTIGCHHHWWCMSKTSQWRRAPPPIHLTLSVFTIISPFFVCYVPLLTFLKDKQERSENNKYATNFLAFCSMTPLILVYLLIMDAIYIVSSAILAPIAFCTCGVKVKTVEKKIDKIYNWMFGMSDMDIKGFRRLRTMS